MNAQVSAAIRLASKKDAGALAELATQLGYPSSAMQIKKRFAALVLKPEQNAIFVAELDGRVVGWVHVHVYSLLVEDPEAEIGGLVVDESIRGLGIGANLMSAAENWACEKKCPSVYLRSNTIRIKAHEFYKRIGYRIAKSQYAFRKIL